MSGDAPAAAPAPTRAQLEQLEQALRAGPQLDFETTHTFGPGFYVRTVRLPAGAVLTGKVHATEHVFFVSEGDISIATEEGVRRVGAGFQCIARAGLKRAGYCHAETVCGNVHLTHETDLVKLEAALIEADALTAPEGMQWLG